MPGGAQLVGFTRILHRTQPDLLMHEASACSSVMLNILYSNPDMEALGVLAPAQSCTRDMC